MAKEKEVEEVEPVKEEVSVDTGIYKGYDIRWLREIPEHPDFYLVAEYDEK